MPPRCLRDKSSSEEAVIAKAVDLRAPMSAAIGGVTRLGTRTGQVRKAARSFASLPPPRAPRRERRPRPSSSRWSPSRPSNRLLAAARAAGVASAFSSAPLTWTTVTKQTVLCGLLLQEQAPSRGTAHAPHERQGVPRRHDGGRVYLRTRLKHVRSAFPSSFEHYVCRRLLCEQRDRTSNKHASDSVCTPTFVCSH